MRGVAVGTRRGLVLVVALILATSGCRWIVRASVDSAGNQANGDSYDVALSADGRFVAFESDATNLVPNDTNGDRDVFVRDNRTGAVERVFETPYLVDLSEDGRYVGVLDLGLCGGVTRWALWIHDRQTGINECVQEGVRAGPDSHLYNSIVFSATARFVASANGGISVLDRSTNQVEEIPIPSGHSDARDVDISDDGRYVAFDTYEERIISCRPPPFGCMPPVAVPADVFVHDRRTGTTDQVPLPGPDGYFAGDPSISGDGRWVAYALATEVVNPPDVSFVNSGTWIYDVQTGTTEPVSVDPDGIVREAADLSISDDGRFVAFSGGPGLDPEYPSNGSLYVRDMVEARTTLINTNASGTPAHGQLFDLEIADDARYVAFTSLSADLVGGDTNEASDVFLRAIPLPRIESVAPSSAARGTSRTITILGDGFAPQPTVQVGAGVSVTAVTRVSEHELSVRITVDGLAQTGVRTVSVKNTGTGPGPAAGDTGACNGCLTIT
jgi:hypothetical protein